MFPDSRHIGSILSGTYFLLIAATVLLLMIYGQGIILPIIISIAITFVINDVTHRVSRFKLMGFQIPQRLTMWVTILLIVLTALIISRLFVQTAFDLTQQADHYLNNLNQLLESIPVGIWELIFGTGQGNIVYDVEQLIALGADYVTGLISTMLSGIVNVVVQLAVCFFYILFMLMEQETFTGKVKHMFPNPQRQAEMEEILSSISDQTRKYIAVKTYVSFLTGLGSFFVMWMFDLDFAVLWAILIFMLNYIPYVGSIIAVTFPVALSLVQFGAWGPFLGLLFFLFAIQIAVGYVIEPMLLGNSLDISAFVVLASLSIFGAIWGIAGMILAVPIVIILIIILSHFDTTRPFAILLSGNGVVYGVEGYEPIPE